MRADSINNQLAGRLNRFKDRLFGALADMLPRWMTPNIITTARIVLVIPVILLYQAGFTFWAATVFIISLVTDALDGIQARRLGLETTLGKLLDPAADKILVIAVFLMIAPGRVGTALLYTIVSLEAVLVLLAVVIGPLVQRWMKRKPKLGANNAGKIKMTLESFGVLLLFVFPTSGTVTSVASAILWIGAVFAFLSIVLHLFLRESSPPPLH